MGCVKWMRSHVTSLEVVMFLFMFGLFMVVITSQVTNITINMAQLEARARGHKE